MNTTLLEVGNMTDAGLPTGRRISFNNSFAIRGQFFNYSTAGQWMWDEIIITIPASANPRQTLERIQKVVNEDFSESASVALREWKGSMHRGHLSRLDTSPVVNLVTIAAGYEIHIRFVTRAATRFDTRISLYRHVFDAIQEPGATVKTEPPVVPQVK